MSDWLDEEELEEDGVDEEEADWLSMQPPTSGDELSPKSPGEDPLSQVLYDDCTPALRSDVQLPVPGNVDPKHLKVIHAARQLMPRQRTFIRALIQSGRNVRRALDLHNARASKPLTFGQVTGWMRMPVYLEVLQAAQEHFLNLAGVDPKDQLFKAVKVFDEAMTPAPILFKGKHTGFYEQDRANGMRALEHIGKLTGATREADTTRVTVQIVNLSSREEDQPNA